MEARQEKVPDTDAHCRPYPETVRVSVLVISIPGYFKYVNKVCSFTRTTVNEPEGVICSCLSVST